MMSVTEFAKYVVDNLCRATIGNALNISTKLNNSSYYDLNEFIKALQDYVETLLITNKIDKIVAYKILIASYKCHKMFNNMSIYKYNAMMIIDTYIIEMWEAVNK